MGWIVSAKKNWVLSCSARWRSHGVQTQPTLTAYIDSPQVTVTPFS